MARGVNKVILIGNLGADPELRQFSNGGAVANATLATSDSWKDKSGNQQERTEWHNVVFHNKLGEIAAQYLRKGSKVYIEGKIRTEKWQDKNTGQDRYTTKIHVEDMQMLDSRPNSESGRKTTQPERAQERRPAAESHDPDPGFEDDDIPF